MGRARTPVTQRTATDIQLATAHVLTFPETPAELRNYRSRILGILCDDVDTTRGIRLNSTDELDEWYDKMSEIIVHLNDWTRQTQHMPGMFLLQSKYPDNRLMKQ
jgi:hypothetical protein